MKYLPGGSEIGINNNIEEIAMAYKLKIIWKRQGDIQWEEWWVQKYGQKRTKIPDLKDHISFANFDMKRFNASIIKSEDELFVQLESGFEMQVFPILLYHGFDFPDEENKTESHHVGEMTIQEFVNWLKGGK